MLTTVSIILAATSPMAAVPRLTSHPRMRASAASFGIAWQRYQLIGVAELAATLGVLAGLTYKPLGVLAAICLAPLLLGAICAHLRAGEAGRELGPALLVLAMDALYLAVAVTS
jgi:hypothetical protein